jgi:hypothetical protein
MKLTEERHRRIKTLVEIIVLLEKEFAISESDFLKGIISGSLLSVREVIRLIKKGEN